MYYIIITFRDMSNKEILYIFIYIIIFELFIQYNLNNFIKLILHFL